MWGDCSLFWSMLGESGRVLEGMLRWKGTVGDPLDDEIERGPTASESDEETGSASA